MGGNTLAQATYMQNMKALSETVPGYDKVGHVSRLGHRSFYVWIGSPCCTIVAKYEGLISNALEGMTMYAKG